MKSIKPFLALVVLPLVLTLIAGWQLHRVEARTHAHVERLAAAQELRVRLDAIAARGDAPLVQVGEQRLPMAKVLPRLRKIESNLQTLLPRLQVMRVAAALAVGMGLLAAGTGVFGLWSTIRATSARTSAGLLDSLTRLTRRLPRLLAAHAAAMSLSLLAVLVFEGMAIWHAGRMGRVEANIFVVVALFALGVLYSLWHLGRQLPALLRMFERTPVAVLGEAVTPQQAPGLWARVHALAERQQALAPDNIVLGITGGFYITASDVHLFPCQTLLTGCTLHVPLPWLGLLDDDEVHAILAHELAHHAGDDIVYTRQLAPLFDSIDRSLSAIAETRIHSHQVQAITLRPAFLLGLYVQQRFEHAVGAWRRERELIADAASVRLTSSATAAAALVRFAALAPELDRSISRHVGRLFEQDDPEPIEDLPAHLFPDLARTPPSLAADAMAVQLPHPSDAHPSNGERLAAMGADVEGALLHGLRPLVAAQALHAMDRYVEDARSLRTRLTSTFLDQFRQEDEAITQTLQALSGSASGETLLHEGARRRGIFGVSLIAVFVLAGAGALLLPWLQAGMDDVRALGLRIVGSVLLAFGLLLAPYAIRLIRRADRIALQLTPDHFVFANFRAPLAIHHIEDADLRVGNGLRLRLLLTADAPAPEIVSRAFFSPGASFDRNKRIVNLQLMQLCRDGRKLAADELTDLLGSYLYAGSTRRSLRSGD